MVDIQVKDTSENKQTPYVIAHTLQLSQFSGVLIDKIKYIRRSLQKYIMLRH